MALNKLNIGLISNTASDGNEGVTDQHVLTYVAANNSVEFKELSLTVAGVGTVSANADAVNTQLTANIDTVQDNVTSTISLLSSSNTDIDTVQANLDTFATYANTNYAADAANSFSTITVGDANVVATTTTDNVIFATGNGIAILANADSQSLTFSMYAGDIKSDYFTLDGTSNTVTLSTDNRPEYTLYVTVGGLIQEPGINYTVSSTTLTLNNTYPILNGTDVEVRYLPYTGEIAAATPTGSSYSFQGSTSGYTSGGNAPPYTNVIDNFPFSSDTNATDVGDVSQVNAGLVGQSSTTSGYNSGGITGGDVVVSTIDKFPFSSDTNATSIATLTQARRLTAGQSSSSSGYTSGGTTGVTDPDVVSTIDKFPFSSDTNATSVGNLVSVRRDLAGQSSTTHGYTSGGFPGPTTAIEKFPFSSDTNATSVGVLTQARDYAAGQSSTTHGYTSGGLAPPYQNTIDKFTFSSDSNAIDVGELTQARMFVTGQSSTTHGYTSGGFNNPYVTTIDKFPFSSDTSATSVGVLTQARGLSAGQQV